MSRGIHDSSKIEIYWFASHCFKETTIVRLTLKNLSFSPKEILCLPKQPYPLN